MIIAVAGLLALLSPALTGGHLARLSDLHLTSRRLILAAFLVQVLIIDIIPGANPTWLSALHVLSYVLAGGFVLANRAIPGLGIASLGVASNAITITINGGTLPASPLALRAAGITPPTTGFVNSGALAHPHLAWLGDVFDVPHPLPLANVFSIGDLIIVLGVGWGAHRICGSRLVPGRPPRTRPPTETTTDTPVSNRTVSAG
jgi:Family of unknown function (DUF5317)